MKGFLFEIYLQQEAFMWKPAHEIVKLFSKCDRSLYLTKHMPRGSQRKVEENYAVLS